MHEKIIYFFTFLKFLEEGEEENQINIKKLKNNMELGLEEKKILDKIK